MPGRWRGRNVNTSGTCVGTCVEEIKRIARNPGGISMQGFPAFPNLSL